MPPSTATAAVLAGLLLAPVAPAQPGSLNLIPDDATLGLVVRSLADVLDKGEKFFEDHDVDPNKATRPATLLKQLLGWLGVSKGLDEKGAVALVLPNLQKVGIQKVDPNDLENLIQVLMNLVLIIPVDDFGKMAGNFNLKQRDLVPGKIRTVDRGGPPGAYVLPQGKHLLFGLNEKSVRLVAERRPLGKALSPAHA